MQLRTNSLSERFSKNTYCRFLNSAKANWLRFTTLLAKKVADTIKPLTGEDRVNAFIVDDSLFERTSCKKTQLGAKVFDRCDMRYKKGFRLMTLSWTDGNTMLPVNNRILSSVSTNTDLLEDEIIRIYGKRWQIEVFFKTCKSMLNLVGECHSLSYDDALTAHVAIVFARYTLIALTGQRNTDMRTIGEIFFFLADEMADITFAHAFDIILNAVFESIHRNSHSPKNRWMHLSQISCWVCHTTCSYRWQKRHKLSH